MFNHYSVELNISEASQWSKDASQRSKKSNLPVIMHRSFYRVTTVICICLSLLITSLLAGCNNKPANSIIVAGSTSVQPFAEVLAEEYMRLNPEISIDIQGGGSSAGIKAAQSNTADIGMSSRDLKADEQDLWSVKIAKDGLAVIVHPSNPIKGLTLNQVRDIYAASIVNWDQLGGSNAKIHVFTREEGSGTRDAFKNLVMGDAEITPKALVQDSNGAVRQLVAGDEAAIGFVSLGLVNEKVKAFELEGVSATHENIINGSYKLSRPFLFITRSKPTGEVKAFIDFVLSAEGKRILTTEGLVAEGLGGVE
jgi:phosphate transport system substrate-binding protein